MSLVRVYECLGCGQRMIMYGTGRPRKWCSSSCVEPGMKDPARQIKEPAPPAVVTLCAWCGRPNPPQRHQGNPRKYCSKLCTGRAQQHRVKRRTPAKDYYEVEYGTCLVCLGPYCRRKMARGVAVCPSGTCPDQYRKRCAREKEAARYAADPESKKAKVKAWRDNTTDEWKAAERERIKAWNQTPRGREYVRAVWQRRRAQKLELPSENVVAREVYERDAWVCGICEDPIDPAAVHPDPMSPSVDHIEPLSLGGHHTYENVRAAHLRCNVLRGNRVA